jgi:hypothetical protein
MKRTLSNWARRARTWLHGGDAHARTLELMGRLIADRNAAKQSIQSLRDVEFRVFSQWGDDGIIQWLVAQLPDMPRRFVEFGVEDYSESNTRFLLVNNNWGGLVMDGAADNMSRLRRRDWFWRHDLTAVPAFVTRENVDRLIAEWLGKNDLGLLHIDVDGNDYWLWDSITCTNPSLVIMEYNALFGSERAVTVPYSPDFRRHVAHYSGQFFGASLAALAHLAESKGYVLIGSNSAGNNAYFVRRDLISNRLRPCSVGEAFVEPKFRDSRDESGQLNFDSFKRRQATIRGLRVVDVINGNIEPF